MRKLLISAAALTLFSLPAFSQHDHDRGPRGGPQGGGPAPQAPHGPPGGGHFDHGSGFPHDQSGANPSFSRGANGGSAPRMTTNPTYSRGPNGSGFNHPAAGANPTYNRGPSGGGDFHHDIHGGRPNGFNPGDLKRTGRPDRFHGGPRGDRHDFHGFVDFHRNFNAPRHFRIGPYHRPAGWYPRRWTYGEFLPTAFWARDYWLLDYMDYALPPPPFGAVWVRVGDDALLIDQDTGEIITVEYGVFY